MNINGRLNQIYWSWEFCNDYIREYLSEKHTDVFGSEEQRWM